MRRALVSLEFCFATVILSKRGAFAYFPLSRIMNDPGYRNVVRRRQRERANLRQRALDFAPAAPTQVSKPPGDPVTMDDLLEACGSELTRNQLVCLEKYREAGSYAAAARALDMDDGNLRKTVLRAIKRLKTCARRKKIGPFAQK